MERSVIEREFYIEDHAVIIALVAKEAAERHGEEGREAAVRGISAYCVERGLRAAARCLADGEELSMENYILYGEWDDPRGASRSEITAFEPDFRTGVFVCGWHEAWKKHGLLEYGRVYCDHADKNLVRGFNPELTLKMGRILSKGEGVCEFDWVGARFRDAQELARRRREKIPHVVRDFLYHCGHAFAAMRREMLFSFGLPKGCEIMNRAASEYKKIFGAMKKTALLEEAKQNFLPL
jgi:hypothetical protein